MEVQLASAKINKYAVSESGDTLEVVERPRGGISVVLADGQTSGRGAKAISILVVRKVIGLLAEGVRDGAAARAASDYLFTEKNGKVSCTLNIVSVDMHTRTLVLTQNNPVPVVLVRGRKIELLEADSKPLGVTYHTRPAITEMPLEKGQTVVVYTDGLAHAGERCGQPMDVPGTLHELLAQGDLTPQAIADALLARALGLDEGRAGDDISVVVLRVTPLKGDAVRRLAMRLPIQPG
jgi:serine phosphatase RsbU (regulator of sigma subunit)